MGNGSFRPRVISALSGFSPGSFRPGSFWPGSIRPWVVSAQLRGSFRPFFSTIRLVTEGQLNTLYMFRLVGECMGLAEALGWFKHIEPCLYRLFSSNKKSFC